MDADGSDIQRLTDLSGLAVLPAWSPDGNKIAFSFRSSGSLYNELYVMDADGSNLTQIYTDPEFGNFTSQLVARQPAARDLHRPECHQQ